ncbi:uncharacterized protein EI97DRAFT_462190 [Westerdykella ornata]|uniref:Uncharacterized protein n=1 Tax=Westerdykella ornata TaxID=318751 RepID=A0A6A6J7N8_WESOR|nr:uncharacterized protein EI97DRAFT_462190 [Westerdykella ornata]KAF2272183.1 hypothetical protein EI97DRAFT_462190 [Westerdykella ornata]
MAPSRTITISRPFDARHVSGVNVTLKPVPMPDWDKTFPPSSSPSSSSTLKATQLEPDEVPTHLNISASTAQVPKRSHSLASSLRRPSLRFASSMSRLRGRARSASGVKEGDVVRTATSRALEAPPQIPALKELTKPKEQDTPAISTAQASSGQPHIPDLKDQGMSGSQAMRNLTTVRPKRADSGTAIDFSDVAPEDRPVGFQEIMKVESLEKRMRLYRKTREYWAKADHGLEGWMVEVGRRRL